MAARKNPPTAEPTDAPSFEQALERLETIVEELERGELTLDVSIERYEEGVKLSRQLGQTLDEAERRIERLVSGESGPTTESMELDPDAAAEPSGPAAAAAPASGRAAPRPASPPPGIEELPF